MHDREALISQYAHDRHRSREKDALLILQKVASVVKPIMRQRGWRVGTLTEFYPEQQNLLGLNYNRGQKICLRLRYPTDQTLFLPFEDVVDTMLHELCHNVHGPHNEAFHALWEQLRDEHEALLRKGYTGEGFLGRGQKLGGAGSRSIPIHEARRRAREAADRRQTLNAGSGQRLGGHAAGWHEDIRSVIAGAATRRINIDRGCGNAGDGGMDKAREAQIMREVDLTTHATIADVDDEDEAAIIQAYIELIQEEEREKYGKDYIPPSAENPAGKQDFKPKDMKSTQDYKEKDTKSKPTKGKVAPRIPLETKPASAPYGKWACPICTCDNPDAYLMCDACGSERLGAKIDDVDWDEASRRSPPSPMASRAKKPRMTEQRSKVPESLKKKTAEENHALFSAIADAKNDASPAGWLCGRCGTFMETQWWTCSQCGNMKSSS